jgi:predicted transcriptional regulator
MEVPLTPDLQSKLARMAVQQGRSTETLVVEAVERMVNYDEWFMREIESAIESANRGELVEHSDIEKLIRKRYPG